MNRWRPVRWFGLVTAGLAVALGLRPTSVREILAAYVLAVAAIALAVLVRLNAADPWRPVSTFEHALKPREETQVRPFEFVRTERELVLGSSNAGHLHARLVPMLREAAAARLAAHHSVDLERRPEAARRLLGDEAWDLVRPDRRAPDDLYAPGMSLRAIRRIVDTLERL